MNREELTVFRQSIRRMLVEIWDVRAKSCDKALSDRVYKALEFSGATLIGRAGETGLLTEALAVQQELGFAGCPVAFCPKVALNLARRLIERESSAAPPLAAIGGNERICFAFGEFDGDPEAGRVRFERGQLNGRIRFVEHFANSSQLIGCTTGGLAIVDSNATGLSATETQGLSYPALHDLRFADVSATFVPLAPELVVQISGAVRLMSTARSLGAAQRSLDLVVDHVATRRQFGRPLSAFQAVQHKLADCLVAICSTRELIQTAARSYDGGSEHAEYFVSAAVAFAGPALRKAIIEIQHAFGAVGYSMTHEAPIHFLRIHGDLVRMGGVRAARASIGDWVLHRMDHRLPEVDMGDAAAEIRRKSRQWLAENWTPELQQAECEKPFVNRGWNAEIGCRMGADDWLSMFWPETSRSPFEQLAFTEEFSHAECPTMSVSAASWIVAPLIVKHGTPQLKAEMIPLLRRGELHFALAYSEAGAGSDLASLSTKAVRDGSNYVITGQKLWGTGTDKASHVILAARTDSTIEPKHAGISLFIVPLKAAGISIVPEMSLSGHTFSTQFYDNVVVSAANLLGPENGGWSLLTGALATERILMGGNVARLRRLFEDLCFYVKSRAPLCNDTLIRDTLGGLGSDLEAARCLVIASVQAIADGGTPIVEGAMTKLVSGDLAERLSEAALDILGTSSTLSESAEGVPLSGRIEQSLRRSLMMVIGGGTAEIQRNIIAQKGLQLGR